MAKRVLSLCVLLVVLSSVLVVADDPPMEHKVFLPVVQGHVYPNLVPNPSFEQGLAYWRTTTSEVYCGLGPPYPPAADGSCYLFTGGLYNHRDFVVSECFEMEAIVPYEVTFQWRVWSEEPTDQEPSDRCEVVLQHCAEGIVLRLAEITDQSPRDVWNTQYTAVSMYDTAGYRFGVLCTSDREALTTIYFDLFRVVQLGTDKGDTG